ncbi:MAG TPA: hypothetical protein VF342_16780 [Alphaproteobacteria bacterium]
MFAILPVLYGLTLATCTPVELAYPGTEATSQIASARSLPHNVTHAMTGRDCAPVRDLLWGTVCTELDDALSDEKAASGENAVGLEAGAPPAASVFCYRSIGAVDCHEQPDPLRSASRIMAD